MMGRRIMLMLLCGWLALQAVGCAAFLDEYQYQPIPRGAGQEV